MHSTSQNIFQSSESQNKLIYYSINDQFGLFFDQYWYLLDISEFIYYWIFKIGIKDYENVPQMVSWPFQVKYQFDQLESFKEISGIELDQLDSHTVVLRSLPSYIKEFDYHKIIDFLLSSPRLPQDKEEYLGKLKSVKNYFFQSADYIQSLISSFNKSDLIQQSFIMKIDHSLLNKVFKK